MVFFPMLAACWGVDGYHLRQQGPPRQSQQAPQQQQDVGQPVPVGLESVPDPVQGPFFLRHGITFLSHGLEKAGPQPWGLRARLNVQIVTSSPAR